MRRLGLVLFVLVVGLRWGLTTSSQVALWTDERAIWAEAVRLAPNKPRPWVNLGRQYDFTGDQGLAEMAYLRAIDLAASPLRSPDEQRFGRAFAMANLAIHAYKRGDRTLAMDLTGPVASGVPDVARLHLWLSQQ